MPVCCIVPCPAEEPGFYSSPFVHDKKILHPTSSLTTSKSITSPPNTSNGLIPLNNTETSRSNPARNKLRAGLPCFFTLIGRRLSSASPARQDSTKPIASTDINLSIFAGAVICVSSKLNPLLFRQPNSVSICQRSPYASVPCPLYHRKPPASSCPSVRRGASR